MKIKPCPNCGSRNITAYKSVFPKRLKSYHLECNNCHFCTLKYVFRFTAELWWNRMVKYLNGRLMQDTKGGEG